MNKTLVAALLAGSTMIVLACDAGSGAATDTNAAEVAASVTPDFIEGQVKGPDGAPEAGVWVIAETRSLDTPYRKIVVTDDAGRFVIPELPEADYKVWVRGYGLADSSRVAAERGGMLDLVVEPAASEQAAAAIYPANYWLSLMELPEPGTAEPGTAEPKADWSNYFKLGCQLCHQMGSAMTRHFGREQLDEGLKKASYMDVTANGLGREVLLDVMTDWSGRINAGEVPPQPPRPTGAERNVVITQWDWGDGFAYVHDLVATDKRDPTRYPNGKLFGVDIGNDRVLTLDPINHRADMIDVPTRDGFDTPWCEQTYQPLGRDDVIDVGLGSLGCPAEGGETPFHGRYHNPANPHNPMLDDTGRVWLTTQIRREWGQDLPEFCKDDPVIAENYHHRQLGWYDPKHGEFELIDTCYGTHHLQFDTDGVLWTSGDSHVIGWFDPSRYDPERPETLAQAQGWSELVVDSNGDGEADTALEGFIYGVNPALSDGSVWISQPGGAPGAPLDFRGRISRYDPERDRHEAYIAPRPAAGPRGLDVDSNGIVWVAFGGSGHLGRFDRSQCQQHWGLGEQCPEGWTLYRSPGPQMRSGDAPEQRQSADFHYYLWVDLFGTLGMGDNLVILNGTGSDSLLAFDPESEAFTVIRVPYPLNTFTRLLDGRIDDADAGWKGRALWFNNALDPVLHSEHPSSYVGKVQMRPDPLAR